MTRYLCLTLSKKISVEGRKRGWLEIIALAESDWEGGEGFHGIPSTPPPPTQSIDRECLLGTQCKAPSNHEIPLYSRQQYVWMSFSFPFLFASHHSMDGTLIRFFSILLSLKHKCWLSDWSCGKSPYIQCIRVFLGLSPDLGLWLSKWAHYLI